jgi:hypothetical protein
MQRLKRQRLPILRSLESLSGGRRVVAEQDRKIGYVQRVGDVEVISVSFISILVNT